jgi:hypothetical protein
LEVRYNSQQQGSTPKNDFCRILSRNNILYPLSLVLNKVLYERSELSEQIEGRIVHIFHIFSQAENYVKENIADNQILKREPMLNDVPFLQC